MASAATANLESAEICPSPLQVADAEDDADDEALQHIHASVKYLNAKVTAAAASIRELDERVNGIIECVQAEADARVAAAERRLAEALEELAMLKKMAN